MSTPTPRARKSGFTLVEVAIALAIFVFGALAIVQIFPPALGVIRNNESRVAGTQLSETLLARTSGKPVSLPDAVYESDATGNWLATSDIAMAIVGTPSKNASLPASPDPAVFGASALSRFKYVSGERHPVQIAAGTQYVLLNFPVDIPLPPATPSVFIDSEEEISGVQIDEYGQLNFQYATDSAGQPFHGTIPATGAVPQPADKADNDGVTYYVSYKWSYTGQPINAVLDEPLRLTEAWTGTDGRVLQGVIDTSRHIIPGAVKVRYRQRLGAITPAPDQAAVGYLNLTGFTAPITTGKTYSFSYLAADWRWMVDDRNAPSSAGLVQLPVKNLDQQPVGTLASVLGLQTTIGGATAPAPITPTLSPDEYKNGTVPYGAPATGARYRTVYRALDGWAQQLSVAAKSYVPFYATRPATSPAEPWREYSWATADAGRLYFHASEAGKSVIISFSYNDGTVPDPDTVSGAVLTINDDLIDRPASVDAAFAPSGKVAFADITDTAGNPVPTTTAILSVQGLSVHARTAWQNADRYNQVIVPAYRTLMQ